jgi:hypothetical protein
MCAADVATGHIEEPSRTAISQTGSTMRSPGRITNACLSIVVFIAAQTIPAHSLQPASPEFVSELTRGLSITPQQATGGARTLFGLAKSRLSPPDFSKIAAVVPGMGSFSESGTFHGRRVGTFRPDRLIAWQHGRHGVGSDGVSEAGALARNEGSDSETAARLLELAAL